MSKLKKVLLMCTAYALVAALAVGGTLAYLQDEDSDVNVMTLGNVSIAQHEYERALNEDGTYKTDTIDDRTSYVLQNFTQGKALLPIVGDPSEPGNSAAYAGYDTTVVRMTQVGSYGGMDVFAGKNAQDKFVVVENTGKTDAYVRTLVAIEVGTTEDDGKLVKPSYHFTWEENYIGTFALDGNEFKLYEYVYSGWNDGGRHVNGVLTAGDTAYPSFCQVYLKHNATNEYCEALDGNGNGTLDILVLSQAVQAAGFDNAQTALDAAFGTSEDNAATWFGGVKLLQYAEAVGEKDALEGEDAEYILDALNDGQDLLVDEDMDIIAFDTDVVDAQGATVTMNGQGSEAYGYLAFVPEAGEDVTVSNLNVTGSGFVEVGSYGQGGGTYVLNNVNIIDFASTIVSADKGNVVACGFGHFGTATLNNCVMTGTTAVQDGAMPVDLGCFNGTTTTINGGEYGTVYCWNHATVTINGAKIEKLQLSPVKGSVTINTGSEIDTIVVDYGTGSATAARLAKIVINDGATVGQIVFGGNSYTVAEWNAYVATL